MGARLSRIMRNLLIPCVEELETGDGKAWGGLSGRPTHYPAAVAALR
jgi:hypothetical protein